MFLVIGEYEMFVILMLFDSDSTSYHLLKSLYLIKSSTDTRYLQYTQFRYL